MRKQKKMISYTAVFTPAEGGGYTATVPELAGCISEGDTFEEAKENIEEALALYLSVVPTRAETRDGFIVAPVSVLA